MTLFGLVATTIAISMEGKSIVPGYSTASLEEILPWPIFVFVGLLSFIILVFYCYFSKEPVQQKEPTKVLYSPEGKYKAEIYQKMVNSFYVQYFELKYTDEWAYMPKSTYVYDSLENAVMKSNEKFKKFDELDEWH